MNDKNKLVKRYMHSYQITLAAIGVYTFALNLTHTVKINCIITGIRTWLWAYDNVTSQAIEGHCAFTTNLSGVGENPALTSGRVDSPSVAVWTGREAHLPMHYEVPAGSTFSWNGSGNLQTVTANQISCRTRSVVEYLVPEDYLSGMYADLSP